MNEMNCTACGSPFQYPDEAIGMRLPCPTCEAANTMEKPAIRERLITCPDCARQISRSAPACPHCGCPRNQAAPTPEPASKKVFYTDQSITVMEKTITVDGTVYSVAQINSVRVDAGAVSIISLMLGLFFSVAAITAWRDLTMLFFSGSIAIVCGVHFFQKIITKSLVFSTSNGDAQVLKSSNLERLQIIRGAVIAAISKSAK